MKERDERMVRMGVERVTDAIDRPVMDKDQVVAEILLVCPDLTLAEMTEVAAEVCMRFGV